VDCLLGHSHEQPIESHSEPEPFRVRAANGIDAAASAAGGGQTRKVEITAFMCKPIVLMNHILKNPDFALQN
jgi:hypothetical protein